MYLRDGGVQQFWHVLIMPAFAQQTAMCMRLGDQHYSPALYNRNEQEVAGVVLAVDDLDEGEQVKYSDEPWHRHGIGIGMLRLFLSLRKSKC